MRTRRLVTLLWSQINVTFALSHSYYYFIRKKDRLWELPLVVISLASLAAMLSTGVYWLSSTFYRGAAHAGQGGLTVMAGLLATQSIIMVIGLLMIIGVFYYSRDLTILIPLPLRAWEVLAGKFGVVMVSELLLQLIITLPMLIAYAVHSSVNPFWFWLHVIPVFLLLPAIPLVFSAIPAILLMRLARSARRRDMLVVIAGFGLVFGVLGIQYVLTSVLPEKPSAQAVEQMLRQADGLVDLVGSVFPPSLWAAKALLRAGTADGFLNLVLFAAASLLATVVLLAIGERAFYRGLIEGFEVGATRKGVRGSEKASAGFRSHSAVVSLAWTEVRLFARTPVFVLNGFLGFVLLPALLLIARLSKSAELTPLLTLAKPSTWATTLVIAAYLLALITMSTIPFSPFSREGIRNLWITRALPVPGRTVALAKVYASLAMVWIGSIPGVILLAWMFSVPPALVLTGMLMGMAASAAFAIWGVLVDMFRPMLYWTSQAHAIKLNFNTVLSLVTGVAFGAGLGYFIREAIKSGFPGWAILSGTAGLILFILLVSWLLLMRTADHLWLRLEL